jgi:hypothetical protein
MKLQRADGVYAPAGHAGRIALIRIMPERLIWLSLSLA